MSLTNYEIAQSFTELADRLDIAGESRNRVSAYRRAADTFAGMQQSVELLSHEGTITSLPGIGKAIAEKVHVYIETGTFEALQQARADVPDGLLFLTGVTGVGPATARKVWETLEPADVADLLAMADAGRLAEVPRLREVVAASIQRELPLIAAVPDDAADDGPVRRDAIAAAAAEIHRLLAEQDHRQWSVWPAGDHALGHEIVEHPRIVVSADVATASEVASELHLVLDAALWLEADADMHELPKQLPAWTALLPMRNPHGTALTLVCCPAAAGQATWTVATGPAVYVTETFPDRDWLNDPPVMGDVNPVRPDGPLHQALMVPWRPPELRDQPQRDALDGNGDDAASQLVRSSDIRGELHAHSTWTDGKQSVLDMARACIDLGYDYLAITDHSAPYGLVGGLDGDRLARQLEEVDEARSEVGTGFAILQGIELEITASDGLGLPDDVLERLDWVVASIHQSQRQPQDRIHERCEHALTNPFVDCIGHPTSRLILARQPTELDVAWLIGRAAETGTFLEINANPHRLDLAADHARLAAESGVLLQICTDAHDIPHLEFIADGIAVARRAGLRAQHILNTRSWPEIAAMRKRQRAATSS